MPMRLILPLLLLLLLAACTSSPHPAPRTPASHAAAPLTVTGQVVIEGHNSESEHGTVGELCVTDGNLGGILATPTPFDDVKAGAQVVVSNAAGATVGVGALSEGITVTPIDGGSTPDCSFAFSVDNVPAGSVFYGVKVGQEPVQQVPAARVTAVMIPLGG